jgi:hypothetical protein
MGLAAPVLDFTGTTIGALSLGFPATRENDGEYLDTAIHDLKQAAAEISANLGYMRQDHAAADAAAEHAAEDAAPRADEMENEPARV